jgi:carboxyl-terminal processing protease
MPRSVPACLALLLLALSLGAPAASSAAEEGSGGIGIMLAQLYDSGIQNRMGDLVVLHVTPGGPAARGGIRRGDLLTEIDGVPVAGREFAEVTALLRGPIGSSTTLTIMKPPGDKTLRLVLKRTRLAPR